MKSEVTVNAVVDMDEAFDLLDEDYQTEFIRERLDVVPDEEIARYLRYHGYSVTDMG